MGRDWRGGRLTGRAAAGLAAGDALGDLSKMLFALAGKKAEEERKAAEQAAMTSKEMLPFLRLQMQLQRQQQLDQRHAEERKTDLEFRQNQAALAQRAQDRQDKALTDLNTYRGWQMQHGTPDEIAARAAAEVAARVNQQQQTKGNEIITDPDEANKLGVKVGTRREVTFGKTAISMDQRIAAARTVAFLDRAIEASDRVLPDVDINEYRKKYGDYWGRLKAGKVLMQSIANRAELVKQGNPDAVYLDSFDRFGAQLARQNGETGNMATKDVEMALSGARGSLFATRRESITKLKQLRAEFIAQYGTRGIKEQDFADYVAPFKAEYDKIVQMPAATDPAAAGVTTPPATTPAPTATPVPQAATPIPSNAFLEQLQVRP